MLTAIISGKGGRITVDGVERSVSWREIFRQSEDLMTAAIFGRLRYLSPALLTQAMGTLVTSEVAARLGALKRVDFWRNLEGTHGRVRVQPDVLMWFENALVIVEVKPPFGGNQHMEQWEAQIHAIDHLAQDGDEQVPEYVHYVGLGRNEFRIDGQTRARFRTSNRIELCLYQREWDGLTRTLMIMQDEATASDAAVLEDISNALQLFGMITEIYKWDDLVIWAEKLHLDAGSLEAWPRKGAQGSRKTKRTAPDWGPINTYAARHQLSLPS